MVIKESIHLKQSRFRIPYCLQLVNLHPTGCYCPNLDDAAEEAFEIETLGEAEAFGMVFGLLEAFDDLEVALGVDGCIGDDLVEHLGRHQS